MVFKFEALPSELLWLILEYIPPMDLFHGFFNLNQRFNMILRLMHYRINLLYTNENKFNYYLNTMLPNIQHDWIESLYIDDINDRLYSINLCKKLQSLTIYHLRTENIASLARNTLTELKELHSLRICTEFQLKQRDIYSLINVIFSEQMPSLEYCHLGFQDHGYIDFDGLTTSNHKTLSLKKLIVDRWCRLRDFIRLLHFIPNITHLTVRLFDLNAKGPIPASLNTIDDFTILVPNLIYLRAKLAEIPFDIATKLLFVRLPTNLRELSLSTWSFQYGNGTSWETLLSSKFPHLKHFRLIISLDRIPQNYSIETSEDLDNVVKSFNQSKYFLDHHWNVLINANEFDRLKFVLHTIRYPIENFQTTLNDIRRSTTLASIIKSAYRYVTKLSLTLYDQRSSSSYEHRYFPNVDQLTFYSNLRIECSQYPSIEYFNGLKEMINLSNITYLSFPEENHQYPIELVNLLLKTIQNLNSLTIPYGLYQSLNIQSIFYLKSLTLIFATYSSAIPPTTRMHNLLTKSQILTNEIILELVQTLASSFSEIQTLTLIVRDLDGFDIQFSEWLKANFSNEQKTISYDLLLLDKTLQFYF